MGRIYRVNTGWQAVSAIQDVLSIVAIATSTFRVHALYISQSSDAGDTEAEMLQFSLQHATGAFTIGSVGSAVTIDTPVGGVAPEITARRNDTTQATGGTIQDIHNEAFHVNAGMQYRPLPIEIIDVAPTDAFIVSLNVAPADAVTLSATAVVEEIGGA